MKSYDNRDTSAFTAMNQSPSFKDDGMNVFNRGPHDQRPEKAALRVFFLISFG